MRYKINLIIFILSIIILINRSNFIILLIGWDGLGISSFYLILFYMNFNRLISRLVTFFFNRFGDRIIIIFCCLIIRIKTNIILINFNLIIFVIIFLGLITKRSQIPFGVWLPIAISAPTPISSLVHSSTLVTAGIFLIIKFNYIFFIIEIQVFIIFLSLLTFFLAGIFSLSIIDFKKAIAFSTLSQIGFILFSIRIGNIIISFYHLIFHAFFKSSLFVNLGIFILINYSMQDFRLIKKFSLNKLFKISFFISCINLIGLIFSSGFLSKDYILIFFFSRYYKIFINLIFFIGCIFTGSYCLKFIIFFIIINIKILKLNNLININIYFIIIIVLIFFLIFIPIFIIEFLILDFLVILLNRKFLFYIIIIFSIFIYKIFIKLNKLLFNFSEILYILDILNFILIVIIKWIINIYLKLIYLEEYLQSNFILFIFNKITFRLNLIFFMNLFIFLFIILNFYLPNQ